jgi:hypothetical protein
VKIHMRKESVAQGKVFGMVWGGLGMVGDGWVGVPLPLPGTGRVACCTGSVPITDRDPRRAGAIPPAHACAGRRDYLPAPFSLAIAISSCNAAYCGYRRSSSRNIPIARPPPFSHRAQAGLTATGSARS